MENNAQRIKTISAPESIENLNRLLKQKADSPPKYDPFTISGKQQWEEWAEGCREIERQLKAEGVQL
jgi:hypothetical protein